MFDLFARPYRERAASYDLSRINDLEIPSIIFDRNRQEIGRIFVQNRSLVTIDDVPEIFIQALTAGEDSRFFSHSGVDYMGVARAVIFNLKGNSQGASTITQQLARNAYPLKQEAVRRKETTIQRKLVEAFLAIRIEKRYNKREILEFYLNRIYFGSGFYGIRSASLGYYGKEPLDLTASESASLVTLIKNPNARSPLNNLEANRAGRNYVLGRMREEGMLKTAEMVRLQSLPLVLNPRPLQRGTSHLYERIADAVGNALGPEALAAGGFKIHTTIMANVQHAAEQALETSLNQAEQHPDYRHPKFANAKTSDRQSLNYLQGAVLMIDHETGEVLAHVGGRNYAQVPYDFIELGRRPLGTALFPFLYAAGLTADTGNTPATLLEDEPMDNRMVMVGGMQGILGEWGMEVAAPTYQGKMPLRQAFEQSKIAASVRFANSYGLQKLVDTAVNFGLPLAGAELLPRLAVGFEEVPLKQLTRAMSSFPLGGRAGPSVLHYIDRIENAAGRTEFIRARSEISTKAVIDDATAWQVHSMMAGSLYRGSSRGALDGLLEKPFYGAGKGGSTHDFADTWFSGYNKRITCSVWTGFLGGNQGAIYPGAFSRDLAMPVWQASMNAAADAYGGSKLVPPATVEEIPICTVSGQRATQFCHEQVEDLETGVVKTRSTAVNDFFRKGSQNLPFCSVHSGGLGSAANPEMALTNLPAMDAVPIRPKSPALIGDDPYHTEMPSFQNTRFEEGLIQRRTNVLDSLDLQGSEEPISLPWPDRLEIMEE